LIRIVCEGRLGEFREDGDYCYSLFGQCGCWEVLDGLSLSGAIERYWEGSGKTDREWQVVSKLYRDGISKGTTVFWLKELSGFGRVVNLVYKKVYGKYQLIDVVKEVLEENGIEVFVVKG